MVGGGPIPVLKELTAAYREEIKRYQGHAEDLNPHLTEPTVGAIRHIYVAGDESEVEQIARPAYSVFYHNITKLWRDFRTLPDYGFTPDLAVACKFDVAIVGTAEEVRDEVGRFSEQSGCNYLVLSFAWGRIESRRFASLVGAICDKGYATICEILNLREAVVSPTPSGSLSPQRSKKRSNVFH